MLALPLLLLPYKSWGETRVAGSTVSVTSQVPLLNVVGNFDTGSDTNQWGGVLQTFASGSGASLSRSYTSANAFGGTGQSLKLDFSVFSPGSFAGCVFNLAPNGGSRDLGAYKHIIFNIRTNAVSSTQTFKIELINASGNAARSKSSLYLGDYLDGVAASTWKEVKIPLEAFANLDSLANVKQINFVFESDYAGVSGFSQTGDVEIDNLGFGASPLGFVRIDSFGDNFGLNALGGNVGEFAGGNNASHSHSYDGGTYHNHVRSLRSNYNVTEGFAGIYFIFGGGLDGASAQTVNFSAYSQLTLWIRADTASSAPAKIKLELADGSASHALMLPDNSTTPGAAISAGWQKYTIPFANFGGLDKAAIKQLTFVYEDTQAGPNKTGTVFYDEIQFE